MILSLAAALGLFAQAPPPDPVRVWRTDSTVQVALEGGGYVTLLHVDPDGRISVLFPLEPDLDAWVANETPLRMALPPTAQGNPATFVAIRSRWPFDFAALRGGGPTWDYHNAWLLQPTAGDPVAGLLDIADRVTGGRPYDYGVAAYARGGAVATRRAPLQPDVCFSCYRHATAAPAPTAVATNNVDCTNASLTNSFCGVNSGSVSITSAAAPPAQVVYQPAPAPAPVYVPYYVPVARGFRRLVEPPPVLPRSPMTPASRGLAFPIAPRLIVPASSQLSTFSGTRH
jgi:hypothetical protein